MTLANASLVAAMITLGATASAQADIASASTPLTANPYAQGTLLQPVQYHRPGDDWYDRDGFRDRRYWDRRRGGRDYYNRNYRDRNRDDGAAVAAGFLGFVLGAAIAGSANERTHAQSHLSDRSWAAECSRRYRSFDPGSGTYLGYDGYRRYCQL